MGYPPLSELAFSPDVGVDYYLWSLQISGVGTLLTGINFVTTILKLRAPGMTYFRMPVFCWTALAANLLIVAAFPVLTEAERAQPGAPRPEPGAGPGTPPTKGGPRPGEEPQRSALPRRFFGTIEINPDRAGRDMGPND
jgi:Cytochrome C and Quinol oxidase polypeptide I